MREKIVDVAGTVEVTDHVDTSLVRQVEEEVVLEAFDWKPAKAFQARNAGVVQNADPRMIDQLETGCINGGEVAFGQFHAGLLAEVDELFQQIESSRGR